MCVTLLTRMWCAPVSRVPRVRAEKGESVKNAPVIERQYRLVLGCLVDAKVRGNLITSKWRMFTMASPGFVRPETGQTSIKVE